MLNENGNGNQKTILGIPCKGCTERAKIMGAGNWHVDAIVLVAAALIVAAILYTQFEKQRQ